MRADNLDSARCLYEAFAAQDAERLLAALTPDFRGEVSQGMPLALGRTYRGAEVMLRECWAPTFAAFDVRPVPDEYLAVGEDRMIVIGRYTGTARATNRPFSAAFAHVLTLVDGRVSEIRQITDTGCWRDALDP